VNEPILRLTGPGRVSMSGGCIAPMSLVLQFFPLEESVEVHVDNKWTTGVDYHEVRATISTERFCLFARELLAILATPPVEPTLATSSTGITVQLPFDSGELSGTASQMLKGPAPGPLVDAVLEFTREIERQAGVDVDCDLSANRNARLSRLARVRRFWVGLNLFAAVVATMSTIVVALLISALSKWIIKGH
jgi:hypothetical protein